MSKWQCPHKDCGLVLDVDDDVIFRACSRCGKEMEELKGGVENEKNKKPVSN